MRNNAARALVAGVAAGATRVVGQGLLDVLVFTAMYQAGVARPAPAFATPATMAVIMSVHFLLGIATIYLYAAMLPRFGGGPRAVVGAGVVMWAIAAMLFSVTVIIGFVPWTLYLARVLASLPVSLGAALAGATVYRAPDATSARARTVTA